MEVQKVLEQVICFSLEEISLWGARKKLHSEDLQLSQGDALPPKDLASLGSKKIFNPKALAKFEALKKRAHVACSGIGIPFMGGYAVPETSAEDLAKKLDQIGVEFDDAKSSFIANYQGELDTWIAKHPGWEQWIRAATIPVEEVKDRIRYGWTPARVSAPDDNPGGILNRKMTKEAGGLAGRLFEDVAKAATKVMTDSLLGKTKVNRRVLSPIRKIRGKLNGLSFLDKRVSPLITAIDDTLAQMPGNAPIEGLALTALHGLILTLSDTERMKQHGQAILDGDAADLSIGETLLKPAEPVETTVEILESPEMVTIQTNLFADDPIVVQRVNPVVEQMPQTEAAASASDQETLEVADEPKKTDVAESKASEASAEAVPVTQEPMVRVVEVVRNVEPALPPMMPPPQKPMQFRRITF